MRLCRRAGLEAVPLPADHRSSTGETVFHPAILVPQAGALKWTQNAAWELLGALVGR